MMKRFTLTVASLLMGMTAVMAQNTKVKWRSGNWCISSRKRNNNRYCNRF